VKCVTGNATTIISWLGELNVLVLPKLVPSHNKRNL